MNVKCDDKTIKLTKQFIEAVKNLMTEQILMFRVRNHDNRECWVIGACTIEDMMSAKGFVFQYGGIEDASWLINDADIFVEVPL